MKLAKIKQQGLRLAICLAKANGPLTLPELSKLEHITEALVAKIMGKLRRGGAVAATRGRIGGYALTAPAETFSIAAIFKALGRPVVEGCFTNCTPCPHREDCSSRPIWEHLETQIIEILDLVTLADLIHEEKNVRKRIKKI